MYKKINLLILLLISYNSYAFDFKGIELDKEYSSDHIEYVLNLDCLKLSGENVTACSGNTTIADSPAEVFVTQDNNNKVISISITFSSNDFETVSEATFKKFGKPKTCKKYTVKNALNAKFTQIECDWYKNKSNMSLKKYDDNISQSSIRMYSNDYTNEAITAHKKKLNDI